MPATSSQTSTNLEHDASRKRHAEYYEALVDAHQAYREQQPIGPDYGDALADAAKAVAGKEQQELLAEVDRLREALADQERTTRYYADQAKRRGDELAELRNERAALLKRLAETENEPRWQHAEWDAKRRYWNLDTEDGAR